MLKYTGLTVIGICHGVQGAQHQIADCVTHWARKEGLIGPEPGGRRPGQEHGAQEANGREGRATLSHGRSLLLRTVWTMTPRLWYYGFDAATIPTGLKAR
jgi:hypothetical protein